MYTHITWVLHLGLNPYLSAILILKQDNEVHVSDYSSILQSFFLRKKKMQMTVSPYAARA
jgi:hypothetical protein